MYYLPGELEVNLTNCKNADLEIFTLLISGNQEINFNFESLTYMAAWVMSISLYRLPTTTYTRSKRSKNEKINHLS